MDSLKDVLGTTFPKSQIPLKDTSTEYDFLASERARAERMNQVLGSLTGWDCPDCLNRGYLSRIDDHGCLVTRPCRCMAIRNAQAAMRRSGLPDDILQRATWESWTTEREWQKKVLETARKFVERSLQEPGAWFYIGGRPGAGKTKLCSIIFRALNEGGVRGRYISWRDFSQRVKGDQLDNEKRDELMKPVLNASVLYIDDLWKGGCSPADIRLTFDILNARYQRGESITLISSEISLDTVITCDEGIGSRIAERAQGFSLDVTKAEDYRLRRAG